MSTETMPITRHVDGVDIVDESPIPDGQKLFEMNQLLRTMSTTYVAERVEAALEPIRRRLAGPGHRGATGPGYGPEGARELANAEQKVLLRLVEEEMADREAMVAANAARQGDPDERARQRVSRIFEHRLAQHLAKMTLTDRADLDAEVHVLRTALANAQALNHDVDAATCRDRLEALGAVPPNEGTPAWVLLALEPDVTNPAGVMQTEHAAEVERIRRRWDHVANNRRRGRK